VHEAGEKEKTLNRLLVKFQRVSHDMRPATTSWSRFDADEAEAGEVEAGEARQVDNQDRDYVSDLNLFLQQKVRPASGEMVCAYANVIHRDSAPHLPVNACTVKINGQCYDGPYRSGKQKVAKQAAAAVALRCLMLDSSAVRFSSRSKQVWDFLSEYQ
jgi:hypothetical protein